MNFRSSLVIFTLGFVLLSLPAGSAVTLNGIEKTELASYYSSSPVSVAPNAPDYTLPLEVVAIDNFSHVASVLGLTSHAQNLLQANGFVVVTPVLNGLDKLRDITYVYGRNTKDLEIPNFITSDTLLHLYHVLFDETLKSIEEREFFDKIKVITQALLQESENQYNSFSGDLKEAAGRNAAFFAVAMKLLDPASTTPDFVSSEVNSELSKINAHAGFAPSDIFIYNEDYSQYVPRGHYTRSETLEKYFKAMMWYGRIGFLVKGGEPWGFLCDYLISEEDARIQTIQASLITIALDNVEVPGTSVGAQWDRIYAVTSYFVGLADDLTPYQYLDCIIEVFSSTFDIEDFNDTGKIYDLKVELALLPSPEIYGGTGMIYLNPLFTPEQLDECLEKTKGMRLMGQRFIPDSYMLQNLVFPKAGPFTGSGNPFTMYLGERLFPRGLDVMGVLGSARAVEILEAEGDRAYLYYEDEFDTLCTLFNSFTEGEWNKNLYWSWLYSLKSLLGEYGPGYPCFMRTNAWQDKQLNAALASWTQLRHDTILYAKQSYTPGYTSVPDPDRGYVEPVPEFYNRLLALTAMTRVGLMNLNVLDQTEIDRLTALQQILSRLISISIDELEGRELSEDDYDFIKYFANELGPMLEGLSVEAGETTLVADVHTDITTRQVLEEGVGYIDLIVAAYKLPDGRIVLGAGPVFSYYEFKWPMSDRLTDEKWKQMLEEDYAPQGPDWTRSFKAPDPVPETLIFENIPQGRWWLLTFGNVDYTDFKDSYEVNNGKRIHVGAGVESYILTNAAETNIYSDDETLILLGGTFKCFDAVNMEVQTSTDLINWTTKSIVPIKNGAFSDTDTSTGNVVFYRLKPAAK